MRSAQDSTQQTMLVTNIAAAVTTVHCPADTSSPSSPLSGVGPSLSHRLRVLLRGKLPSQVKRSKASPPMPLGT